MKTLKEFYVDAWYRLAGRLPPVRQHMVLKDLRQSEWSDEFEQLMRNRLLMGAFRYGKFKSEDKKAYDRISSIRDRLSAYEESGNDEHLVDIANLCLCEFLEGTHPQKHFAAIDDGVHTAVI